MNNRFSCNLVKARRAIRHLRWMRLPGLVVVSCLSCMAGDAPQWMHSKANVSLPSYDEKTDAVLLYSETNVTVVSPDRIKTTVREVYKILRPNGRSRRSEERRVGKECL